MLATADQERCVAPDELWAQAVVQQGTSWHPDWLAVHQGSRWPGYPHWMHSRFKPILAPRRLGQDGRLTPEAALACASLQVQPPEGWAGPPS